MRAMTDDANSGRGEGPAAAAPDPALVEEVRVAMALNGGVSLAVWMGGCAVELDAARRAHLGPEAFADPGGASPAPPERSIYHALCRAFHRELIIDLMTGSSAGGINGALLAAAIHRGRRLHADYVREKWISLGDFQKLLRGLRAEAPTSLMNGTTFRDELCTAFKELLPAANQAAEPSKTECLLRIDGAQRTSLGQDADALETAVKLEITATDVLGQEHRFRDEWGEELIAREYRQRFRFRACEDFEPELLADAARSSASFPLAFEPWRVPGERLDLEGDRWLIDGGLLDNAPIQSVLKLIPARASRRKVQRYVCYVNADPPLDPSFLTAAENREATRAGLRRRNGTEPDGTPEAEAPGSPRLQDVVGYMVNLPRKATFVDHLNAIQRAAGQSLAVEKANTSLLALDRTVLRQSADALLPAYRSRRRLLALGEHFGRRPADIRLADERIREVDGELPWIPQTMEPPAAPGWGWGVRPAQRVLYLLLDLIRHAADHRDETGDDGAARELHDAQRAIYEEIEALEAIHAVVDADPHIGRLVASLADRDDPTPMTLCSLRCRVQGPERDEAIRAHVRTAAAEVLELGDLLGVARAGEPEAVDVRAALFGPDDAAGGELSEERFERFLERTLGIEVVRRAFAADDHVDSDQPISFAQITPCAPALLLTERPISADDAPATPNEKLTGTGWGHFAGFYRRSWRANDFMWGRLDASVRVVDMLVDAKRAEWVSGHTDVDPAGVLADALWPADEPAAGSADANLARAQRRLIAEVLTEAEPVEPSEAFREGEWRREQLRERLELSHAALHEELRRAIADDLAKAAVRDAPPPALTRALCVRAAQLEVLCHEYGNVVATSVTDLETGTAAKPLEPVAASWEDTIEQLRTGSSLPRRLGARDDAERSSTLMIRTTTRSALVALAAMRATKLPLSRALNFPGTLLLPAAGIVARQREWALAVALAFWVIALFVAGRVLSVSHGGDASDVLSVVVTYLGVAGLLSACVVPVWRMRRGVGGMHLLSQGLWLVALLATGLGAVVAAGVGDASWGEVALQRGADPPPWYLLVFAAASFGFVRWLPKPLRRIVQRDTERWRGALSLWRLVPWAAVAVWAGGWPLRHELLEGRHGLPPAAGFALIAAPLIVATAYVLLSGRRLPARWRGPVAAVGERAAAWFRAKRPRRGRHPSGVAAPDGA